MTTIYFVRHAQSDFSWIDDETRPLTSEAKTDLLEVEKFFSCIEVNHFYSSPYKRAVETISTVAGQKEKAIVLDHRLRERTVGIGGQNPENLKRRWEDFSFCEPKGESLGSVQKRNIEVLRELLLRHPQETLVIGTHGTALSTIINYFDPRFGIEKFLEIINLMPYITRFAFEPEEMVTIEEQFFIRKKYTGKDDLQQLLVQTK